MQTKKAENQYVFEGTTSQWISLGKAGKALYDAGLKETMQRTLDSTMIAVFDVKGNLLVTKSFHSVCDIDYAAQWMHKQARDFKSWH